MVSLGTDGKATIGIEVVAEEDGKYTINYYKEADIGDNLKKKDGATPAEKKPVNNTVTGYDKKTQTKQGAYVNIYGEKTLNGNWRFSEIEGEAIPEEE